MTMEALNTALLVGEYTIIGGLTASMGVGILSRGMEVANHTRSLLQVDDGKAAWQKVGDIALSLIGFIGITSVTLEWAQFLGWISLGVAAPFVAFIGYPAFAITNGYLAFKEFQSLCHILQGREDPLVNWKAAAQVIRALSKTCLVAVSVLGGIGFLTGCGPLSLAAFISLIVAFMLLGSAYAFDRQITQWERPLQSASVA